MFKDKINKIWMNLPYIYKKNVLDLYETKCAKGSALYAYVWLKGLLVDSYVHLALSVVVESYAMVKMCVRIVFYLE